MPTDRALAKQIVATYAEALFDAATASDSVDAVAVQLEEVGRAINAHADLRMALTDGTVPPEARAGIVTELFGSMDPALVSVLALMAERGEFDVLGSMIETYVQVAEARRGVVAVSVTTAVELSDGLRQAIKDKLAADIGKQVVLREKVDPSIIGGIVISAHGKRLDASISSQLDAARVTLSTAPTGGEV